MNKLTQIGLATAILMGASAPAMAFQTYSIAAQSDGVIDVTALEYLDFIGNSFIDNTFSTATDFTFTDNGVFVVTGHDGVPQGLFGGSEITTTLTGATGTGSLSSGIINFAPGGILSFYSDSTPDYGTPAGSVAPFIYGANDGTLIGTFILQSGNATIDPSTAVPNGFITLNFKAETLLANTWFDELGNDLSLTPELFDFVTSNATRLQTASALLTEEVVCQQSGFNCPTGTPFDNAPENFLVSNNGQNRINTVPEPASLALMGIGLLGFSIRKHRRA